MYDIVYYNKKDELAFIDIACKLKFKGIIFLHSFDNFIEIKSVNLNVVNAILCAGKEVQKARKKTNLVFVQSSSAEESDRRCMEKEKPDGMLHFECASRKDFKHHRNSGLNHILAKIMRDKKIAYVLDCSLLVDDKTRARVLGRVEQNVMLMKKYKVTVILGSFAKEPYAMLYGKDVCSLLSFVGLNPQDCKQAYHNAKNIAEHNVFKKTDKYIAEGVRKV